MTAFSVLLLSAGLAASVCAQTVDEIHKMEFSGDTAAARGALMRAAQARPTDLKAQQRYADFLSEFGDPASREAYSRVLGAARNSDPQAAARAARQMAILELLDGDRSAATRELDTYRAVTGKEAHLGAPAPSTDSAGGATIPGPLRSFARMAAISPDSDPADLLPALARNVVTNGYQASHSSEALEQTEYLKLVHRYISQARELEALAGESKVVTIETCESPKVAELLRILGFRIRGGCGSEVVLETVNASRAFLTTDSGFPVNELEQALRTNRPFSYDFHPTPVPVLFGAGFWQTGMKDKEANFLEAFISDPSICRLYLGLSKLDPQTADALRKGVSFQRLRAFAHILDFFGGMFQIRNGKAVVPGAPRSVPAWADLVGANPDNGVQFYDRLIAKDDGWLCSLYDALARINGPVRDYLTDPARMKRFYTAVRGRITSPGPARPVFRSNTDMMLLTTRLRIDSNGRPHIPGNLEIWKNLFINHPQGKYDAKLSRLAANWKDPDDVLEALFALCRKSVENEPLKIFMAITDLDRNRTTPLAPATVELLARDYRDYGSQYSIFAESGAVSDASIVDYLDTAAAINGVRDPLQRADAAGSLQSLVSLWQILVRQGTIPERDAGSVFASVLTGFHQLKGSREIFDATRGGLKALLAASGNSGDPSQPQERLVMVLSGGDTSDAETRDRLSREILRILDSQRIVSLDTIFQLADHLESIAGGTKLNTTLVNRLASRINEIQLPRLSLTGPERTAQITGYWTEKHIDQERKLNLRAAIEKAGSDPEKLRDVRGQLVPLLRDTLLALSYAYYAPPGAQILYTNPLFVRNHDFIGGPGTSRTWRATDVMASGWPANAGGRLVGSLSTLPYALAEAEQNFLVPTQTQALIWGDLVPQMILSAKTPRWWNVTPAQMHWVGLHMRYGRELLGASAFEPDLRRQVVEALAQHAPPGRAEGVDQLLAAGEVREAAERVTPSELFLVAREIASTKRDDNSAVAAELHQLADSMPAQINYGVISHAFGTPKPTLVNSYQPELLHLRTFPTLMGYSSRIMAESWESNTLYWAALADELSVRPTQLNVRIPEWTEKLVERIFASHLEDWPAVLKSLRTVGEDVRTQTRATVAAEQKASVQGGVNQ
jgi:hypothetical protein